MIRFWDTEVYCMEKSELDRGWLFSYFCQKGHTDDMILVYDAGAYYGYLNYQTLLHTASSGRDEYIITEKYVHKKDDAQIWEHLHVLLKQLEERGIRKQAFIPVFDEQGQLLYFAYEYEKGLSTFYIDIALMELQEKDTLLFFEEAYPRVKNVKVQTMYFPTESRSKTSDEEIRRMHRVFPLEKRCWDDIVGRSQIKRIIGEKIVVGCAECEKTKFKRILCVGKKHRNKKLWKWKTSHLHYRPVYSNELLRS